MSVSYPLGSLAVLRQTPLDKAVLAEPWRTIAAVQEHLFPADADSPGAYDIHAISYLKNMLQRPGADKDEAAFIEQGEGWLNGMAREFYAQDFITLDVDKKERVLRRIEGSRAGYRWLGLQLRYILEALLSDPVYGGNANAVGWEWLQHQPGFPTPTERNLFYKLAYQKRDYNE